MIYTVYEFHQTRYTFEGIIANSEEEAIEAISNLPLSFAKAEETDELTFEAVEKITNTNEGKTNEESKTRSSLL